MVLFLISILNSIFVQATIERSLCSLGRCAQVSIKSLDCKCLYLAFEAK